MSPRRSKSKSKSKGKAPMSAPMQSPSSSSPPPPPAWNYPTSTHTPAELMENFEKLQGAHKAAFIRFLARDIGNILNNVTKGEEAGHLTKEDVEPVYRMLEIVRDGELAELRAQKKRLSAQVIRLREENDQMAEQIQRMADVMESFVGHLERVAGMDRAAAMRFLKVVEAREEMDMSG
ncbi:hypothetical protein BO70DRAFT_359763 [Aspergillus heteromorphus CBS 117.55]|uniref:Uncharacterized protein n=1 Tax=Aspergillus heteromorphus CBS 117.55 TaxID=1448321 RepID=A0A317WQI7_9EURO|nr:uncharacterized protein BO70DRAFT_359763 [Aspergillus heteromorphus CBS 117.55]PWY88325.1 hypothetical protein BO70DRAFT_359763 [Aspergillus heteromorphus CBS 117.55]